MQNVLLGRGRGPLGDSVDLKTTVPMVVRFRKISAWRAPKGEKMSINICGANSWGAAPTPLVRLHQMEHLMQTFDVRLQKWAPKKIKRATVYFESGGANRQVTKTQTKTLKYTNLIWTHI